MPTRDNLREWLETNNYIDQYKAYAKQMLGRANVDVNTVYEWAHGVGKEIGADVSYDAVYGKKMTRDELRSLCETSKEDRKLLRQKVIDKWEAKEDAVSAAVGFNKIFDIDD